MRLDIFRIHKVICLIQHSFIKKYVFGMVYYVFQRLQGNHGLSVVMATYVTFITKLCQKPEVF